MNYIGIDFGTTNSVVADFTGYARVLRRSDDDVVPSVVCLRSDGTLAIGQDAKEMFLGDNGIRSIKTFLGRGDSVRIGDDVFKPVELAGSIFRKLKTIAEENLGETVTRAVVTVPANSKGLQRQDTKIAAGIAGLRVLTLINEPTAAAMAYGLGAEREQKILVYDFGGGTFDVTILKIHHGVFEELASKGIGQLGGDDIDKRLAEYVREECLRDGIDIPVGSRHFRELELVCERAKIRLSEAEMATVRLLERPIEKVITRALLTRLIGDLVGKTKGPMDIALEDAGLTKDEIDTVIMVGGTSKIPAVREFVEAYFGRQGLIATGVDPLTCVAQGAAIASALIQDAPGMEDYAYSVKLEHSLCATPMDPITGNLYLDPIIPRGRDIPCASTSTYSPVHDFAEAVQVQIYEGDVYHDLDDPENVKLGEIQVPLDPPRPREEVGLAVTFRYTQEGILNVTIADEVSGQAVEESIRYVNEELSPKELVQLANQTEERMASAKEYKDAAYALKQCREKIIPAMEDEDARSLEGLCRQLVGAMEQADDALVDELTVELNREIDRYPFLL